MIGHGEVRQQLEAHLPPVTLLRGPRSVGKWTLAGHLADHHRVQAVDRLTVETLVVDIVRAAVTFVGTAPFGAFKLVTLSLDHASEASLNALLKVLEEPPATARFILVASGDVPATIVSRAQTYRLGLLTDTQVRDVLIAQGMSPAMAARLAPAGRGQVDRALRVRHVDWPRSVVVDLMQAVATHDLDQFERTFRGWEDECRELLVQWVFEALTKEWSLYSEREMFGLHRKTEKLREMLLRLGAMPRAQSRLGVRVALEPFLAT